METYGGCHEICDNGTPCRCQRYCKKLENPLTNQDYLCRACGHDQGYHSNNIQPITNDLDLNDSHPNYSESTRNTLNTIFRPTNKFPPAPRFSPIQGR